MLLNILLQTKNPQKLWNTTTRYCEFYYFSWKKTIIYHNGNGKITIAGSSGLAPECPGPLWFDHLLLSWGMHIVDHVFLLSPRKIRRFFCIIHVPFVYTWKGIVVGARCICHLFNRIPMFGLCVAFRQTPRWIDRPLVLS